VSASRATRIVAKSTPGPAGVARPDAPPWVLLMPRIPSHPAYVRVKIWRRLQAVGAVTIKNSVYVLPNRPDCVESFQWIARELASSGGQASLCEGQFFDGATDDEIERLFIEARNADYAELADETRAVAKGFKPRKIGDTRFAALDTQVAKLRRSLGEIIAMDFCHASGREAAEGLVVDLERKLETIRSPGSTSKEGPKMEKPSGRTWVTRTGVHVDRIASAWLIRRFIDPDARFKFVPAKGYVPESDELRFDMFEAEFTHEGDLCTFEVLLARMGLDELALRAIGEIVHDIDLRDGKHGRDETAGVRSTIIGLCAANRGDSERISAGSTLFDSLYAFFSVRRHPQKGESST
jgi:hypothetical protein